VRSAMPSVTARRKCSDLIFVKPRFDVYKEVSLEIRAIFAEHTAIIEPLSLDEAYLDVTENHNGIASATEIANPRRDPTDSVRRCLVQQVSRQARLGLSQARWSIRHHARHGTKLCRGAAGGAVSWCWTGDRRENE